MSIQIKVTGNLTNTPELRTTQNGKLVANFNIAHNFRTKVDGKFDDIDVIFFRCAVWEEDGAAEVADLDLQRGDRITLEGVWSKRAWIDDKRKRRIADELRVTKVKVFTETEITRDADGDDPSAEAA
jgi:single-strand DNA-binding protein